MTADRHHDFNEERKAEHQTAARNGRSIESIKNAFRSSASSFVTGDRRPDRPNAADRE